MSRPPKRFQYTEPYQSKVNEQWEEFTYRNIYGTEIKAKETHIQITKSLFTSEAYGKLKPREQCLYTACLFQPVRGTPKGTPKGDNPNIEKIQAGDFYFNFELARRTCPYLYTDKMQSNFSKDMKRLVEAGFIEKIICGKANMNKNIYRLSWKWKYR